jgi:hypothetical protein
MPLTSILREAKKDQNQRCFGRRARNNIVVSFGFKGIDDMAINQLPVDRCLCLEIQWEARINPPLAARHYLAKMPVNSIVELVCAVINSSYAREGVNVGKAETFLSVLFSDWQDPNLSPSRFS